MTTRWTATDVINSMFDSSTTPNVFFPDRALICHEAGHAVGLLHGNDSYPFTSNTSTSVNGCMVTPHNSTVNWLSSTSIDNINGEW